MGYWKNRRMEEEALGYSSVDDNMAVCAKCFADEAIQQFVRDNATEKKCSYCGRRSKKPIATPMNEVLRLIGESLQTEYADPIHENAWDEGEWVIPPRDTDDLFAGLDPITKNMKVYEEIVGAFSDAWWVDKPLWGPSVGEELSYGWAVFVKAVKYHRRYVFLVPKKTRYSSEGIPPDKMLREIGNVITEVGLARTLDAGSGWFRARPHSPAETYTSGADLGTVPRRKAIFSNRMSPAGIPMFYGADDEATAIAETYTPSPGTPAVVTVGKFRTARPAWVVDLTALPPFPSRSIKSGDTCAAPSGSSAPSSRTSPSRSRRMAASTSGTFRPRS